MEELGVALSEDVAPVWVGEVGTAEWPSTESASYWRHLVQFLATIDATWGY